MKRKFADYRNHKSIEKCVYKNIRVDKEKFHGNISLVDILKVKKDWIIFRARWVTMLLVCVNFVLVSKKSKQECLVKW